MIKDYIKYEEKEYQVSTVNINGMLETMIFPVENGVVSGSEVYKFRTFDAGESQRKHGDILTNMENYISEEVIKKYLESKEEDFKVSDLQKYKDFFDSMNIEYSVEDFKNGITELRIAEKHIYYSYGNSVSVEFKTSDGSFIQFCGWVNKYV